MSLKPVNMAAAVTDSVGHKAESGGHKSQKESVDVSEYLRTEVYHQYRHLPVSWFMFVFNVDIGKRILPPIVTIKE